MAPRYQPPDSETDKNLSSMPGSHNKHQTRTASDVHSTRQSVAGGQHRLCGTVHGRLPACCHRRLFPISGCGSNSIAGSTNRNPQTGQLFSEFEVLEVVKSDNGPPYSGKDFRQLATNLGFSHRKITRLWPRANGEVERFMQTVKKVLKTATVEQKPWMEELLKFLRNYRATPHGSTDKAPATALFNRPMRVKLPGAQAQHSD